MKSNKSWKTTSKHVLTIIWTIVDHLFTQSNWVYATYFWLVLKKVNSNPLFNYVLLRIIDWKPGFWKIEYSSFRSPKDFSGKWFSAI